MKESNPRVGTDAELGGGERQLGLVAVDKRRRGRRVMRACMDCAFARGARSVFLTARRPALGFYEKLGFVRCGEDIVCPSGSVLVPMRCTPAGCGEVIARG